LFIFGRHKMNEYEGRMIQKMKRLALAALLALLAVGGIRVIYPTASQDIALQPLALDVDNPALRRVGGLIFQGAWELRSRNDDFGGISALTALADGRFIGVGDAGTLIGFGLTLDQRTDRPFIAPLPDSQGPNKNYKDRDSEGIAHDPMSGQFWISFEANHAIRRYSSGFARTTGILRLAQMQDWPSNKGAESIIRLRDGRFIVIAETLDGDTHPALLFSGDPVEPGSAVSSFRYRPPAGYRVTDGVQLPDGRLAIVNRRVSFPQGFAAKISLVDPVTVKSRAMVSGRVIATLAPPYLVDNMEGIAITQKAGETYIWLISDNNFSVFQRTILMKFLLTPEPNSKKPEALAAPGFDAL
jgi:hypothetical protein